MSFVEEEIQAGVLQSSKVESVADEKVKVGCVGTPGARVVRIVHISDTHLHHWDLLDSIPPGDILVHSGDFSKIGWDHWERFIFRERDYLQEIQEINNFFAKLPHQHKVFVCGNHELNFQREKTHRTEQLMTNAIYLQDSSVTIKGLKIHGSPWNGLRRRSHARGFAVPYSQLGKCWKNIPSDTDILVTHNPPLSILDLGAAPSVGPVYCELCKTTHTGQSHSGCAQLRQTVLNTIKPIAHLFGHCHDQHGIVEIQDVLFSNAAVLLTPKPRVIDVYLGPDVPDVTDTRPVHVAAHSNSSCSVM